MIDAVVISVSDVPPGDSGFVVSAWADFGGGLDGHGGQFLVLAQGNNWRIEPQRQATA